MPENVDRISSPESQTSPDRSSPAAAVARSAVNSAIAAKRRHDMQVGFLFDGTEWDNAVRIARLEMPSHDFGRIR